MHSEFSIVGASLGVTIALKAANNFPIHKLLCVVPGANLQKCIKEGIVTRPIYEQALSQGYTFSDFSNALHDFCPINNLDHLSKKTNISMYLGFWDKMIPYKDGMDLVKSMKDRGLNPKIKKRYFFGHGLTVLTFKNKDTS